MITCLYLKIFTAFSSFPLVIIGDDTQNSRTSVDIHYSVGDGEDYIKKFANGEKVSEKPEILMFTAPYKLCEGGCKGNDGLNIAMGFPIYIGKRGVEAYKNIFRHDSEKLYANLPQQPFKRKTTKAPFTTCKIYNIKVISTVPPPTTEVTRIPCPIIPPGMCLKKIKAKKNITDATEETSTATPINDKVNDLGTTVQLNNDVSILDTPTLHSLEVLSTPSQEFEKVSNADLNNSFDITTKTEDQTVITEEVTTNFNLLRNAISNDFNDQNENQIIYSNAKWRAAPIMKSANFDTNVYGNEKNKKGQEDSKGFVQDSSVESGSNSDNSVADTDAEYTSND